MRKGKFAIGEVLLGLIAVLCAATAATLNLLDPSEGRYAEIGRIMRETGNWLIPMTASENGAVPFMGKPPLTFWLNASFYTAFGESEFVSRLPSFIAACLTVYLTIIAAR